MRGPGETVDAAMLAAAIGIDAGVKSHVRTVVVRDEGLRGVAVKLGARHAVVFRVPVFVRLHVNLLEAVGRIVRRAATFNGRRLTAQFDGHTLVQ